MRSSPGVVQGVPSVGFPARRMAMRFASLAAVVFAAAACTGSGEAGGKTQAGPITEAELHAHIQFLASDLLEGRAPATRGGELTELYLASRLREYGVEPGGPDGSYFQPVPIDVVMANASTISVTASGKASHRFRFPDELVVWPGSATTRSAAKGEVVFVGYGANAPEYKWDDFKGMDLKGKILLVLVNDPPAPESESDLFGGKAMTYYGRWTYKFEEAERQGAAGMLVVHNTEDAGYGWNVVVGSNSTEHRMLKRPDNAPAPLGVRGWIQNDAAGALLKQAGLDFEQLKAQARTREFKPVSTGITLDMSFTNSVQALQSNNVIGVVRGSDPTLSKQYVAYSGHWDHLGVGAPVDGDSIYNGAHDNASGIADLLAIARVAAQSPNKPKRSQLFIFVTAEESGLLGSQYFGEHPTVPARDIVAALNVDGGNVLGKTSDLRVMGDNKSSLGPTIAALVAPDNIALSPDESPEKGYFYRSDHFSFAKVGIPAVSIGAGNKFVGKPDGWGLEQDKEYEAKRYHQPADQYDPKWDLSGAVQLANIVYRTALELANAKTIPTWNDDAEFKAMREQMLQEQAPRD